MDQELPDTAAYVQGKCCVCTHQMAPLFCTQLCHSCHLESVTSNWKLDSVSQSGEHSGSDSKWWSHKLIKTAAQQEEQGQQDGSKMRSDLKMIN